jgi:hypothetical protein
MKIREQIPASQVKRRKGIIFLSNFHSNDRFGAQLETLAVLTIGAGKKKNIKKYALIIDNKNKCYVSFVVKNMQAQLFPVNFWEIVRLKIGLIKINIIDPISQGSNANVNWQKNIGMTFQQINSLKEVVKQLSRLLSHKQVFARSKNDNFGDIPKDILEYLPRVQPSIIKKDLQNVEVIKTDVRKCEVTLELLKPKQNEQKIYKVQMKPLVFSEFYNNLKFQKLFDIVVTGQEKLTGQMIKCQYVSHEDSDSHIVIDKSGVSSAVSNQFPLFPQNIGSKS